MNQHVKKLQTDLGLVADGVIGPITQGALLAAAREGRLNVATAPKQIINPIAADDIPPAGDVRLEGVHQALADLIRRASLKCDIPFTVIEGLRTAERQRELVAKGASKTQNSRHLTGHAVDLWPLDPDTLKPPPSGSKAAEDRLWADLRAIAGVVKAEAAQMGIMVEWGGDWGWDAPHFQLNRQAFPA